ncbi:MAG: hypothetical protein ACTHMS_11565 [Jatrophihabitans sp.]|uniref:hypothetical protein n=1 Tax=Jatrophihabitans sp. TaxID=1932789 RepID=UPI003F7D06CD
MMLVISGAAVVTVFGAATAQGLTTGSGVSYTLTGCRNNGTIVLPSAGRFVCPTAAYTTGNLGKGWNELDLVPIRFEVSAGTSAGTSQTIGFSLAVDNCSAAGATQSTCTGTRGYDVLASDDSSGTPVLNTALSTGTCGTLTSQAPSYTTGGNATSLYRILTLTGIAKNSDCFYDAYARLALGSHGYPGSSLHFNLFNDQLTSSGIGSKDVSIPVKEILPQQLSKDMSASQGSNHLWNVTKQTSQSTVPFSNTCDGRASLKTSVNVTVTWTKLPADASGNITVVTNVYATNPASRVIQVSGSDDIRSGTTVLETDVIPATDVPANSTVKVLTTTTSVASGTGALNDVASVSYTDKATGVPVSGTTQATAQAMVQNSGPATNDTATITDIETVSGAGLAFSVDSTSGASGTFGQPYTLGDVSTGSVSWTSDTQSDSGSVTFYKTVYATAATVATGSLSDTATVNADGEFTTSASAAFALSEDATTNLSVSKTTTLKVNSAQTFTFHLIDATTNVATGDTTTVLVPALGNGPVTSSAITGLSPTGSYYFHEDG